MTYTPFGDDDDTHRPIYGVRLFCTPHPRLLGPWIHVCPSRSSEEILDERPSPLHQPRSSEVGFLPVVEQEDGGIWDGQSTNSIHYQIEWGVTWVVTKDTLSKYIAKRLVSES